MTGRAATLRVIRPTGALFLGTLPDSSEEHRHHVIQGSIAVEGALDLRIDGEQRSLPAVLIAADAPHAVSAQGLVGHFYVVPESRVGGRLRTLLGDRACVPIERHLPPGSRGDLRRAWIDGAQLEACLDRLLDAVVRAAPGSTPPADPRVTAALRWLEQEDGAPDLRELGRRVGLSPDRLRHLLVRETGLPMRRHRRWLRLVRALEVLARGGNATEAAARAGFADAAHFSRAFREAFTFPPRDFLRDSRFVQARDAGER